ncbi:MAG: DNA primase [Halanaerobiales bacterium]|nr:DNA primase [Halanaerobiales bacterium]
MKNNDEQFSEIVKDRNDIVEVVSEYVQLKKTGKNYQGLCPFHQENTPSFTVNPNNQFYYCFGCGKGGDIFNFIMEIENITFIESLKILARKVNMELPDSKGYSKKYNKKREEVFKIHDLAAKYYNYLLLNKKIGNQAFKYLEKRGYNEKDIERYHLGYAPDSWHGLYNFLSNRGFKEDIMLESGLVGHKNDNYYDKFRDRIMFPIFNTQGEVIAFGGRSMDQESNPPKYYNSPETLIFHKSKNLYGINWAKKGFRKTNSAVIMEGYTDVITAHKYGIDNAVASLGTALTDQQAILIKRYVDNVYTAFDPDFAGEQATLKGLKIFKKEGLNVKVVKLPEDADPDDFIKNEGINQFKKLMESSYNLIEYRIRNILKDKNTFNINERINRSKKVLKVLSQIEDPIEQDIYLNKAAEILNIDKNAMQKALISFNQKNKQEKENNNRIQDKGSKKDLKDLNHYDLLIKVLIDNPARINQIKDKIKPDYLDGLYKKAYQFVLNKGKDIVNTNIEEEIKDSKLKDYFMILTVRENQEVSDGKFKAIKDLIIEEYKNGVKKDIYEELEGFKLDLKRTNKLLKDYHSILQI